LEVMAPGFRSNYIKNYVRMCRSTGTSTALLCSCCYSRCLMKKCQGI
jgi:hypothetical protein